MTTNLLIKKLFLFIGTLLITSLFNYSLSQIRDPRPKDQANVFWDGTYPLYSMVSGQEIKPNSNGDYIFWGTTNEDPRPTTYSVKKGKSLTVYKFISYEECALFCNNIRSSKNMTLINIKNSSSTVTNKENQNFNYFSQYVKKDDIGKYRINNPYNIGDESIIKSVDTTVQRIKNNLELLSNNLSTIRSNIPSTESKLSELKTACKEMNSFYEGISYWQYYRVIDRRKVTRILKDHNYSELINDFNYNIFIMKRLNDKSRYFFQIVDTRNHKQVRGEYFSEDEWKKIGKKAAIEFIPDNNKIDFLCENFGITAMQFLNFGLFSSMLEDSIKSSKNKQDIFGYTYIGQVENGVRSGFGTLVNLYQDTIYKGIWKDDMPYQGQFYQFNYENKCFGNCENGVGLKITNTDCVYRGEFKDEKWEGKGEYIFTPNYSNFNNNYMTSTFKNGKEGVDRKNFTLNAIKTENNNLVISRFYNGTIIFYSKIEDDDGYHKVMRLFNSGQIFSGYVADDEIKRGTTYFENGNIYIGTSLSVGGNIEGTGIRMELNSNGTCNVFSGQFVNNKLNGIGSAKFSTGQTLEGLFENGKFIKSNEQIAQEKINEENRIAQENRIAEEKIKEQKTKEENKLFPNDFDPNKVRWNYVKNTTSKCKGCPNKIQCSKKSKNDLASETDLSSWLVLLSANARYGLAISFGMPDPYLIDVDLYECPEFCTNQCKYYYNLNKEKGY
jgi:hypothetical protein